MTIREALHDLMSGRSDLDPAAVLEGYGFDDLSPDALSTALGHFAETSPMDVADSLSPIVTRLSGVPFLDGDLPPAEDAEAVLASGGGVFELLEHIGTPGLTEDGNDPSDFDFGDARDELDDETDAGGVLDETLEALDTFGSGEHTQPPAEEFEPDSYTPTGEGFELAPPDEAPSIDEVEELTDDLLDQLVDVIDDPTDVDPDDIDFDLG